VPINCLYPQWDQFSSFPHPNPWRFILILPFRLRLGLPSGLYPSDLPNQNPICTSPFPRTCHMPRPSHPSSFYHPNSADRYQIYNKFKLRFQVRKTDNTPAQPSGQAHGVWKKTKYHVLKDPPERIECCVTMCECFVRSPECFSLYVSAIREQQLRPQGKWRIFSLFIVT